MRFLISMTIGLLPFSRRCLYPLSIYIIEIYTTKMADTRLIHFHIDIHIIHRILQWTDIDILVCKLTFLSFILLTFIKFHLIILLTFA